MSVFFHYETKDKEPEGKNDGEASGMHGRRIRRPAEVEDSKGEEEGRTRGSNDVRDTSGAADEGKGGASIGREQAGHVLVPL